MSIIIKKVSCLAVAGALAVGALAGCGSKAGGIDGTRTAVTVNDEKISLGEVSFLAHYNGGNLYTYYYNYFGMSNLFDTVMDSETGQTYGEYMVTSAAEELTDMTLLKQHAEEYGVVIDEEAKAAIEAAAQAYIDKNDEKTRAKIGASKEDVIALMERQTWQSLMYDALAGEIDTTVTEEESQQTSLSYVAIELATEEEEDSEEAADEAGEEDTEDGEEVAEEAGEEASEDAEETASVEEQNAVKRADAEALLAAIKAKGETLTAEDFEAAAKEVDDTYSALTGTFTKADPDDTTLDAALVEAAAGLTDGALIPTVVEGTDGEYLYVAMVNKVVDEDATAEKVEDIITERKQENYDDHLAEWKESAQITTFDEVIALAAITDAEPVAFKQNEAEETGEEEADTAEDDIDDDAFVAEVTEETAVESDAAEEAADGATTEEAAAEKAADGATTEEAAAEEAADSVASEEPVAEAVAEAAAAEEPVAEAAAEGAAVEEVATEEAAEDAAEEPAAMEAAEQGNTVQ